MESDNPSPTPEKLVECMPALACLKLVFKCVWLNPLALFRQYQLTKHVLWPITCIRLIATRVGCLPEFWCIYSLTCIKMMTEFVTQSCITVYDHTIMMIHGDNLNRASTSSLSCCGASCCGSALR